MIIPNGVGLHNVRSHAILRRDWLPPFAADATCGQAARQSVWIDMGTPDACLHRRAHRLGARRLARLIYCWPPIRTDFVATESDLHTQHVDQLKIG